jgi:small subunit ribosomal protein S2
VPFSLTLEELLDAGVHYGHRLSQWNPRMKPFIYGRQKGIHIIHLGATLAQAEIAYKKTVEVVSQGGKVLFVGTKPQAREPIREEAMRAGQFYVTYRWLGGTLTNLQTIRKSVERFQAINKMEEEGLFQQMTKKEALRLKRIREKLYRNLEGILEMKRPPSLLFVVDVLQERTAVYEANLMGIPVIAMTDTNADPLHIDYPIPGNDDAVRSVRLLTRLIADACLEGEAQRQERLRGEEETAEAQVPERPKFLDVEEEEELLTMRRVIRKVARPGGQGEQGTPSSSS